MYKKKKIGWSLDVEAEIEVKKDVIILPDVTKKKVTKKNGKTDKKRT